MILSCLVTVFFNAVDVNSCKVLEVEVVAYYSLKLVQSIIPPVSVVSGQSERATCAVGMARMSVGLAC